MFEWSCSWRLMLWLIGIAKVWSNQTVRRQPVKLFAPITLLPLNFLDENQLLMGKLNFRLGNFISMAQYAPKLFGERTRSRKHFCCLVKINLNWAENTWVEESGGVGWKIMDGKAGERVSMECSKALGISGKTQTINVINSFQRMI